MKSLKISAFALVAVLTAGSAFAANTYNGNPNFPNDTLPAHAAQSYASDQGYAGGKSGYIVTYPTNADSILKVSPADRANRAA